MAATKYGKTWWGKKWLETFKRVNEIILSKKELANLTVDSGESWITEMTTDQLKDLVNLRSTISYESY